MKYIKHLSEPWFSLVKTKLKTVEGRLNKGDFKKIQKNDIIEFFNNDFSFERRFNVKVTSKKNYNTFEEYLKKETLDKSLPGIDNIENGKSIYYKYYSPKDENQYGIVAIRMMKIKS